MSAKGTPTDLYKWRPSEADKKLSYHLRLSMTNPEATPADKMDARLSLEEYKRRQLERRREVARKTWTVNRQQLNRYHLMDLIVGMLRDGVSLPKICQIEGMPSLHMVYQWQDNHPGFKQALEQAKLIYGDLLWDQSLDEAMKAETAKDTPAQKLKVETLMKHAAKANALYQEKQVIKHEDDLANLSDDELQKMLERMGFARTQGALPPVIDVPALGDASAEDSAEEGSEEEGEGGAS